MVQHIHTSSQATATQLTFSPAHCAHTVPPSSLGQHLCPLYPASPSCCPLLPLLPFSTHFPLSSQRIFFNVNLIRMLLLILSHGPQRTILVNSQNVLQDPACCCLPPLTLASGFSAPAKLGHVPSPTHKLAQASIAHLPLRQAIASSRKSSLSPDMGQTLPQPLRPLAWSLLHCSSSSTGTTSDYSLPHSAAPATGPGADRGSAH